MSRRKSICTVKEATRITFKKMEKKFHSIRLCQAIREISARLFLMDGTILRRLSELRVADPCNFNYEVANQEKGLYRKNDQ